MVVVVVVVDVETQQHQMISNRIAASRFTKDHTNLAMANNNFARSKRRSHNFFPFGRVAVSFVCHSNVAFSSKKKFKLRQKP